MVEESKLGECCGEPIDTELSRDVEGGLVVVAAEVVKETRPGDLFEE